MKKIINIIKENKWFHYAVVIIIGIILSISLSKIELRDTHDGALHLLRVIGTEDTISVEQIPPIVNPNYCNGSGYAMNLFYPPLVTYIPLLLKLIVNSYIIGLKVFAGLCITLSGIAMYQFTYSVTKKRSIAIFASIFYLIAPYKLANVYKRFAIGEFAAMVFIPYVFKGLYNLINEDGKKHYYIAIGAIGLMLSHTITTLYVALFCIIYLLFNVKKLKNIEIIKKCLINIIFILLVSMLFWLPMLTATSNVEYAIMNDEIISTNGEYAQQHVISLSQLFVDKYEENGTTFLVGIPTILVLLLTIYTASKIDSKYKEFYLTFFIFTLISIFMCSKFFPWKIMPNLLCKLQYPWRMVGFFNFFASFICGVNLYIVLRNISKRDTLRLCLTLAITIVTIWNSMAIISKFFTKNPGIDEEYLKIIYNNKKISHFSINRDYMPTKAILLQNTYVKERQDKTYILDGYAEITNETKENLHDEIFIKNIQKDTELEFPYYCYPGYEIKIISDNTEEVVRYQESRNGYVSYIMPEDAENIKIVVNYVGTKITYMSYIVSFVSFIIFVIYVIYERKKEKENVQ